MRTDSPDSTAPREASSARKRFTLAATFAGLWLIGLGVLSFLTANPITLNREQVRSATDVLTAVVEDANAGTVRVEKSWKDVVSETRLTLPNLIAANPAAGDRFLIPVSRSRDGWRVTLSMLPDEPPLIYPATPESETQLRQLLKAGRGP
ncbi:MAG: hypothetical protein IAG10_02305 [Planctomycetaceae bacterium]|nr:hypothetical protein [Planctomycetaceae bacterium]